jgi:hypothetical protein
MIAGGAPAGDPRGELRRRRLGRAAGEFSGAWLNVFSLCERTPAEEPRGRSPAAFLSGASEATSGDGAVGPPRASFRRRCKSALG